VEAARQPVRAPARDRRQRTLRSAALLSILIHVLGVFLFSLRAPECNRPRDPIGSEELDVDLVAPRLAPPVRHQGPADREGKGEGERDGDEARRARQGGGRLAATSAPERAATEVARAALPAAAANEARASEARTAQSASEARTAQSAREKATAASATASAKATAASAKASTTAASAKASATAENATAKATSATAAERARVEMQARRAVSAVSAANPLPSRTPPALVPSPEGELLTGAAVVAARQAASEPRRPASEPRPRADEALLRLYREAELPAAPAPTRVLAAVQAEIKERERRQLAALTEQRRRSDAASRKLAALDALARRGGADEHVAAIGIGAGRAGGEGEARSARGGRSGSRYGLRFYLSGRQVKSSRVVKPPEAIALPPIRCRVDRIDITPATVRMLVDKAGSVGIAYLLHSSSSRHFDRCAVRHARSIRFRPGHDAVGVPLSVWINVRVEPSLLTAGL
jgi:hypothetical protein